MFLSINNNEDNNTSSNNNHNNKMVLTSWLRLSDNLRTIKVGIPVELI